MKIAVKELKPNPFRPGIPFNQTKIKQLEANIQSTEFWNNIVARQSNGSFELAYGHHRLEALKNLKIKEIDIPVRKLDDATMLKIMAQENMEEWDQSPVWAMEVVKTAYNFLKGKQQDRLLIGQELSNFLSWPYTRVSEAVANLRSTGEIPQAEEGAHEPQPHIKKEVFAELPTQKHATEFRKAVQATGASPKVQKVAAKKFALGSAKKEEAVYEIAKEQMKQGEVTIGQKSSKKAIQDPNLLLIGKRFNEVIKLSKHLSGKVTGLLVELERQKVNGLSGLNPLIGQFEMMELIKDLKRLWDFLGIGKKQLE